ncbi:LysR family transcriptional regulator [Vibrio splendidus]|jgi:LysR family transcriptional activator for leuABCD operon|uniref:LysR family transcriptional regulator n=1 Tax=Vibrio splendidus TaxID=29497 RepID=UPI001FB27105|nr:LysR family transcriptional regulator [Vibrio splendidus]UOE80841.1 LysR family transcriptional regulator [Vibrio splendidus]
MNFNEYYLLAIFAAVVEERKYTKAAKRLGITQPSVSQSISKLRDIYNDPLFVREKLGVRPTAFALEIYPDIADAILKLDALSATRTRFDPSLSKRVFKISTISLFEHTLIPELFKVVESEAPNVTILVDNHSTKETKDMLRLSTIDLSIEGSSETEPSIHSHRIYDDELVVVCRKNHPAFPASLISESEFLEHQHVTLSSISGNHSFFESLRPSSVQLLQKRKVKRQVASYWGLLSSVQDSDNLAIFTRKMAADNLDVFNLKILDNNFLEQKVEVCVYWSKARNLDSSVAWLREKVKAAAINALSC